MLRALFRIVLLTILVISCSGPVRQERGKLYPPIPKKQVEKLSKYAHKHIGQPYKYGGLNSRGWDCSGFVYKMYLNVLSVRLPRSTDDLYSSVQLIPSSRVKPGDLAFFKIGSSKPSHVGIYLGKNKFIHVTRSSGVVISSFKDDYYRKHFIGFGRLNTVQLALK